MKENIVLIGMPGSGKSTVGVLLAKMMGYDFLDSDLLIQKKVGKRLYQLINEDGPEIFAQTENAVNSSIDVKRTVIATGGSVVYGEEAMEHLKEIGTVVYLNVTPNELKRRIDNLSTRGIVMKEGETLDDLYNERRPLYEKYAEITVNCSRNSLTNNAKKIIQALEEK